MLIWFSYNKGIQRFKWGEWKEKKKEEEKEPTTRTTKDSSDVFILYKKLGEIFLQEKGSGFLSNIPDDTKNQQKEKE